MGLSAEVAKQAFIVHLFDDQRIMRHGAPGKLQVRTEPAPTAQFFRNYYFGDRENPEFTTCVAPEHTSYVQLKTIATQITISIPPAKTGAPAVSRVKSEPFQGLSFDAGQSANPFVLSVESFSVLV